MVHAWVAQKLLTIFFKNFSFFYGVDILKVIIGKWHVLENDCLNDNLPVNHPNKELRKIS